MGKIVSIRFKDTPEDQEAARAIMEAFRENERDRLCAVCGKPSPVMVFGTDGQWRCERHDAMMKRQAKETGVRQERLIP